jgi:uncharacterized protein
MELNENLIETKEKNYLYISDSLISNAGKGLFTVIPIYKDEIICYYKGEILTQRQVDIRVRKGTDKYFISMLDASIFDCGKLNGFAKYANDARDSNFKNNAAITIDEENRIYLRASRNIKAGEEIFCGYGKRYWSKFHELN